MRERVAENDHAATLSLDVADWPGHVAGQHVDVRLTAEDGYQAERSYSIASAPEDEHLALTVERIDDGEVSPYLVDELRTGDTFELRGPIGGPFTWRVEDGGPLLLVGGGSGVVPLMAMLRHHRARGSQIELAILVSARSWLDVLYRDELAGAGGRDGVSVSFTLTRERPAGWGGFQRRIDAAMLEAVAPSPQAHPEVFVCGPTPFVENAADLLVSLGHPPGAIRTERFGPTGG
ncbi:MAG: FAD-binding oxidoreductase [Solirubrobacteraceae bacterium]